MEDKKYFRGEIVELNRSDIHFADYNPRKMDEEAKKALRRSLKKFGVVGGIVVNKQTGNTIVGGHQKVAILDDIYKYKDGNDYTLRVEMVDLDEKTEKTLNVTLNNANINGTWDYDKLRELIPDIDYKDAGLTDADMSFIGVDFLMKTEEENNLAGQLDDLMSEVNAEHKEEVDARREQREAEKEQQKQMEAAANELLNTEEKSYEEKKQHMKDVKKEVQEQAIAKAQDMDAYVMLSFDNFEAKSEFMQKFGYDPYMKFIKGEDFDSRCEVFLPEE